MEPPVRTERTPAPYEGAALPLSYGGMASGGGLEPPRARVRALLGTPSPHPETKCGRRESNSHRATFEVAVSCRWTTSACAARVSNPVPRVKSPVHHPSCLQRLEAHRRIELRSPAWKAGTSPQCLQAVVPPARVERATSRFSDGRSYHPELRRRGRAGGSRTRGLLLPRQAGWPSSPTAQSAWSDSN